MRLGGEDRIDGELAESIVVQVHALEDEADGRGVTNQLHPQLWVTSEEGVAPAPLMKSLDIETDHVVLYKELPTLEGHGSTTTPSWPEREASVTPIQRMTGQRSLTLR